MKERLCASQDREAMLEHEVGELAWSTPCQPGLTSRTCCTNQCVRMPPLDSVLLVITPRRPCATCRQER
jgi:hypothetical protein